VGPSLEIEADSLIWVWATNRAAPKDSAWTIRSLCGWAGKTPGELLELQKAASTRTDDKERFAVTDLVQNYIRRIQGRRGYKVVQYSTVKSWFRFHRRKLPDDYDKDFVRSLKSDRPSVSTKLTTDVLRDALTKVRNDPRRRSMILVQFQSFSGVKELMLVNRHYGFLIAERIKAGEAPIELEMKWQRKTHTKAWFTFIGKAAVEALKEYFERERAWPKPGEPIWYSNRGKRDPLTVEAYCQMWARLMASLGYRPPLPRKASGGGPWNRYGVGAHNMRDLAISQSQAAIGKTLRPQGTCFNPESAEYFSGHDIDELHYRQLHDLNPNYRREQYRIVERYIDPYERREFTPDQEQEFNQMEERLAKLEAIYTERLKIKEGA